MPTASPLKSPWYRFFREILLYSGQFALFYVIMNLTRYGGSFFLNAGHDVLLGVVLFQSLLQVIYGDRPLPRFFLTLLTPFVYSVFELREGFNFVWNAAHIGFWIFALTSGVLQSASLALGSRRPARWVDALVTMLNVAVFLFLYYYYDVSLATAGAADLRITRIFAPLGEFLSDPPHRFVVWGGIALALAMAVGRLEIARLKDYINGLFGTYVDRSVRDSILEGGSLSSSRRELCVLFSDIRDFTPLAEENDPEAVISMLNIYFAQWTDCVAASGGVVDKFIGDAIMVWFDGSENRSACDAAVDCALDMRGRWPSLRERLAASALPVPSGFGVGCDFGPLILGDVGSAARRNATVIGDVVNVASRLESATKNLHNPILVSGRVYEGLDEDRRGLFSRLGTITLKGKRQAVDAYGFSGGTPAR